MIHPAPTSRIDPHLARGVLTRIVPESATKPGYIVVSIPNSRYELHLLPTGTIAAPVGKRIVGVINAQARRVDSVTTGGRYIEPVMGRPRRVQGTVVAGDDQAGSITVNAGVPIICRLTDARQSASQFEPGDLVSFDVLPGATFTEQD